jgi:methionyl-tRNA synthetase
VQSERKGFVPCDHEYLNFRGGKFSKSHGATVDVPYFLSKYDPDPPRFYLTTTAPETRDSEACPERSRRVLLGGFCRAEQPCPERGRRKRIGRHRSAELGRSPRAEAWGTRSVANRMLSFAYKRFDGRVPEPGKFDDGDRARLAKVEAGFETVG